MKKLLLFHNLIHCAWKAFCQRPWLLAVLSMLFLLLPLGAAPVAEELLSQGVAFSGVTIGVCAPSGDRTGELLEELTGNMRDVRSYARLVAMPREEAMEALEAGELSAVLLLPEAFVEGILEGTNPDPVLVVNGEKPLEALLTYWVGCSAADLLTGAKKGIYAVLERFPRETRTGMTWEEALTAINLNYVNLTLNRQDMFRVRMLSATGQLPLGTHYGLSLLLFQVLVLPPLFCPLFDRSRRPFLRRLAAVGCGPVPLYSSRLWVCCWVVLGLVLVPGLLLTGGDLSGCLAAALLGGAWAAACCQAARSSALCGGVAFCGAGALTFVSGGLLPPALLPRWVNALAELLPVSALRRILGGAQRTAGDWTVWLVWLCLLLAVGLLLCRRETGEEARL